MKAWYEKKEDYYIVHLGEINFAVPFEYQNGIRVTDKMMDLLIYRYDNDCLEWTYNGKPITEDEIKQLYTDKLSMKDISLSVNGDED